MISFRHSLARRALLLAGGASLSLAAGAADAPAAAATAAPAVQQRPGSAAAPSELPPTARHANADAGLAMLYSGTPIDVTTYHYDNLRTGWNQKETDLTPTSVKSGKFGLLQTLTVDGSVFAEPLLVTKIKMADGTLHDLLVIVTAHDSVYAFDAQTYALLWQQSLGTSQKTSDIGCTDVNPEYGISATPVVVRSPNVANAAGLFLVAATEPTANDFHTQLHEINLATGKDIIAPVEISPSRTLSDGSTLSFDPKDQWARAGLAFNPTNKQVVVSISSHCDNNAGHISGWVLGYNASLQAQGVFGTIDKPAGTELASIWGAGFAPVIDTDGTYFGVTGNGNFAKGGKDWGETVLHLSSALTKVQDYFTPAGYNSLNATDADFGSGGVMALPVQPNQTTPAMAVAMGKTGTMYLLNRANLGRETTGDAGALQVTTGFAGGIWGGPAFYTGPAGTFVYYEANGDVMKQFSVALTGTPALTLAAKGTTTSGTGGSTPIVSSNGATAGTAVLWTVRRTSPVQLEAYDAEKLGAPIYAANAGSWTSGRAFLTPLEANGRVYVAASKTVTVFGLTP